jgi:hypothetical protein
MGSVMPFRARFPRWGHNVTVTFGEPLVLSDLTCKCNEAGVDQQALWEQITKRIRIALLDLEVRTVNNPDQTKDGTAPSRHVFRHDGSETKEQ